VLLNDCLVRSEAQGVVGVGSGLAVGVVFDTGKDPVANRVGLRVCPTRHAQTSRTPPFAHGVELAAPVFEER
jgi:hypothetical protein